MQMGPLLLLLLILLVLSISVIFGNYLNYLYVKPPSKVEEGLLTFYSTTEFQEDVRVPPYSTEKPVHKLYDNFYYDYVNGTVIVLDGEQNTSTENDIQGNTLTSMTLWDRNGENISTKMLNDVKIPDGKYQHEQSMVSSITNTYKSFKIVYDNHIDKYELLYIPWGKETFIHLIQLKMNSTDVAKHLCTYAYDANGKTVTSDGKSGVAYTINNDIRQKYSVTKTDPDDNKSIILSKYRSNTYLYQLCANVKYDKTNGYLVSIVDDNSIRLYPRITSGNITNNVLSNIYTTISNNTNSSIDNVDGFSAGVMDTYNDEMTVLYISVGKRTILVSLVSTSLDNSKREFDIHNLVRFDEAGKKIDNGSEVSEIKGTSYSSDTTSACNTKSDTIDTTQVSNSDSNSIEKKTNAFEPNDYYKFLMYLQGSPDGNLYQKPITNDYILRSQVVPPVCPTCPSCSSNNGICTNCGGNGGSGTKRHNNTPIVDLLENTGSGAVRLVRDAGTGTMNLVRDTASGTVEIAKDVTSGTVGLVKDAATGTVSLVRDTASGSVELLKDVGKDVVDIFGGLSRPISNNASTNTSTNSSNNQYNMGTRPNSSNPGTDMTSYFGALQAKGGNYIPVTADFSRFGR
jgi:hypothetical protein